MIRILVYPLVFGAPPMFARAFDREIDAQDYEDFFRRLGSCHVRRS